MATERMGRIFIDGDSCPRQIRELILRSQKKRGLRITIVSDRPLPVEPADNLQIVQVPSSPDAADSYILMQAGAGDMVITQDIPLAAALVDKGIRVLNDRGVVYTEQNVKARLGQRNQMAELRAMGILGDGGNRFGPREVKAFADAYDRELTKIGK